MHIINSSCLSVALAATLIGLSSCSNPPTRAERMERRSAARGVAEEVLAEPEPIVEVAEEVAEVKRSGNSRSRARARAEEVPAAVVPAEVAAEEELKAGGKVMGPWVAGDQIDSGRPGVKPIEILQVHANGSGDVCGEGKRATLRYVAMSADGSVIDPGRRPFTFRVGKGRAIAGWDVVVAKMRVGDSLTLMLPQDLAYGPSKGDLKFDMELLSFE